MTRIATSYAYQTSLSTLQQRQSDMVESQERLVSGKSVVKASDDPTAAARAERARSQIQRTDADQRGVDASRASMTQVEGALGEGEELLQQARELILSAGNASYGDTERLAIAQQLQGIRDQMLGVANRPDGNGGYLFSGQGSGGSPFIDAPGGVVYAGVGGSTVASSGEMLPLGMDGSSAWLTGSTGNGIFETRNIDSANAWIDAGSVTAPDQLTGSVYTVEITDSGSGPTYSILRDGVATPTAGVPFVSGQAIAIDGMSFAISGSVADGDTFEIAPSEPSLSAFDVLDDAIAALSAPNQTSAQVTQSVQSSLRNVDSAMTMVQSARSQAGEALRRVDQADSRLDSAWLAAETQRSAAEDLDMVRAISEFQVQQTSYSAALQSYSMVQKMSLFDYLSA
jgi:flagellar hook-associated protein 3 FlgL